VEGMKEGDNRMILMFIWKNKHILIRKALLESSDEDEPYKILKIQLIK